MAKDRDFSADLESVQKLIAEVKAEGLSADEARELEAMELDLAASIDRLRGAQRLMEKAFFETVGQAISIWAHVETLMVAITALLLRSPPRKVGVMLYSNQNLHVWLNIIDELFSLDAETIEFRPQWTALSADLRSLNDTRVRLAHHTYFHRQRDPSNPALLPGRFDSRKKSAKYAPLETEEILDFLDSVTKSSEGLDALMKQLLAQLRASRSKSALP